MDIKTRKQAMIDGENIYFTGKPCKHGHMNYRYVQSGSCYDCINSTRINGESATAVSRRERLLEASASIVIKNKIKSELVSAKFRVFDEDADSFLATVWAFTLVRYAEVTRADIESRTGPTDSSGGTAMYTFNCHPDDVLQIRQVAVDMVKSRCDVNKVIEDEKTRERVAQSLGNVYIEPVPAWADRP